MSQGVDTVFSPERNVCGYDEAQGHTDLFEVILMAQNYLPPIRTSFQVSLEAFPV